MGAAVITITETTYTRVKKIKIAWVASDAGAGSAVTTNAYDGKCELLTTVPSGTAAPTDDYDITIKDADGVDVLAGAGLNRDTANTEQVVASSLGAVAGSKLTFAVAAAGNAGAGTCYLYIR